MTAENDVPSKSLHLRQLFIFFIPLGFSASLVTLSHVIINSTLARSANPEFIIATYAVALSVLGIFERPGSSLRQTCSLLVRDRVSFRAMTAMTTYVLSCSIGLGLVVAYSPLGEWFFRHIMGVKETHLSEVASIFRLLIFVTVFSGIRCLYHGIIITNMRTKWLTFGMLFRLAGMYSLSVYFINTDQVTSGHVGAIIFVTGMAIECLVAVIEGRSLVKKLPEKIEAHPITKKGHIFQFYRPLLFSSFLAVIVGPMINTMLGKTSNLELAIASFAIAASLMQLVISFFSYTHQIVLQFYRVDVHVVHRFLLILGFIPCLLIGILGYSSLGPWFLEHVMGITGENLRTASIHTLRIFMILALAFPLLDTCNGILMLRNQTKFMVWSQAANVTITTLTLILCIVITPGWNGTAGALAQSFGIVTELCVVLYVIRITAKAARPAPTEQPG